jgi:hypothetical protein
VHHLNIPKAMLEVRRVLNSRGIAIFAEPLGHNPLLSWYRKRTPHLRTADEHPLTINDLREMARPFSSSTVTYFGLVAPLLGLLSNPSHTENWLTRSVWRLDRRLCQMPLLNRYAWYCVIELRV